MAVLGVVIGAVALVVSARGVDRNALVAAFAGVNWWWVALAAVANMINITAQGWAWRIGLEAGGTGPVKTRHAIAATWVGKAGNQLLPGKVGEIVRVALIRTHLPPDRREISRIAGSVVAQRAFYIAATLLIVAVSTSVVPVALPGGRWAPLIVVAAIAAIVGVLWRTRSVTSRPGRFGGRIGTIATTFAGGAGLLRPSPAAAAALGFHVVGVTAQLAMLECLLRGFDVAAPPSAPLLIIALVGLVGAVPGAPGGAGLNQAALVAPLGAAYGIAPSSALAFALGLQMTVAAVAAAGGLVAILHHRRTVAVRAAFP